MSQYFVYILQCTDNTYYTGITTDIVRRLKEHDGKLKGGAKYTRVRQPVKLVYSEEHKNRSTASKREHELKQFSKDEKRILVDMDYLAFVQNKIKHAPKKLGPRFDPSRYIGTHHLYLGISNPEKHKLASAFKKQFSNISFDDLMNLLDTLNTGKTFEEKTIGPFILQKYPKHVHHIQPKHLNLWLEQLEGWCEIDILCQSTFPPEVFLDNWNVWKKALTYWSTDKLISKRRASIVLLCKSTRDSDDSRLADIAFQNVERLKGEKDILITKAISWILRSMIENFKKDIINYLDKNEDSLPKIAVRETRKKLLTGRK
jgi:putative endonuclease